MLLRKGFPKDTRHEREIFLKTRLDVLLKPIAGKLSEKNAPQIKLNDTGFQELSRDFLLRYSPDRLGELRRRLKKRLIIRGSTRLPMRARKMFAGSMLILGSVVGYSVKPCPVKSREIISR